ncbi:MAG: ABC transporter ATP-binding protein [Candidatus Poribacteria bacterium]|nr:ABC transporter ATP-binding protein [Candidatus Poribacteria bacterium]
MPTFLRFAKYLSPHIGSIALALISALIIAICEMGYVHILADTIDALKLIETSSSEAGPIVIKYFRFGGFFDGIEIAVSDTRVAFRLVIWILAGLLALVLIKGGFKYSNDYLMARVGQKSVIRVRNELYEKILFAPLGVLKMHQTGDLMARVTADVRTWQNAIGSTADITRAIVFIPVFVSVLLYRSFELTALALLVLPLLAHLINQFGQRVRSVSAEIQQRTSDISSQLKETIFGIKIIKSFTAEEIEQKRFAATNQQQYRSAMRRVRLAAMLSPLIEMISAVGVATVFGLGCWQVIQGKLSTGWFIGYIAMITMMFKPIRTIGLFNNILQQSLASAERIFYVLDFEQENRNGKKQQRLTSICGEVEFHDVSFGYDQDAVVKHISFHVKPGEVVALVGPSGSGKTTLVNLLSRFYEVESGEVLIDGMPISQVTLDSLRGQIAIVPQDTILFDGTVMENITYGVPTASREAAIEAAQKANAHDFITQMPKGYETQIGESGMKLSGGQQQRLSIARAILKNPRILVLDEATSSLDSESEVLVQASLANLMKERTTFVIAHRLSTVIHADKILVLERGEIVESGTHTELLEKGGIYQKLCQMQFRQ